MSAPDLQKAAATLRAELDRIYAIPGPTEADRKRAEAVEARLDELIDIDPGLGDADAGVGEGDAGVPEDEPTVETPPTPPPAAPQGPGMLDSPLQWLVNQGAKMGPEGEPRAARRGVDSPLVGEADAAMGSRAPAAPGPPVGPLDALGRGARDPVGISDEMMGEGAALAALLDESRAVPPAASARAMRDTEIDDQANAAEQQAIPHALGRAASTTAIMAPTLVAAPASAGARAALGAAEGGALGAATGAASADDGERMQGALLGGGGGAALGSLAPLLRLGAGKLAAPVERAASEMQTASAGPYGAQLGRLAQDKGRGYVADVGRTMERRGVNQRDLPGPLARLPQGPAAKAERLREVVPQVGRELDAVLAEADALGADVPTAWLRNRLVARAKTLESGASGTTPSARAQASELRDLAGRLPDSKTKPRHTVREVQELKEAWTGEVWNQANPQLARGGDRAEAFRAAAGVPRELLDEAIERKASPELAQRFKGLRDEYGHLRTAQDFAEGREFREVGNQLLSLPTAIAATGGAAGGPAGSLAAAAAMGVTKSHGKDLTSSALRTFQHGLQRVGAEAAEAERVPVPVSVSGARSITESLMAPTPAMANDDDPSGYREAAHRFKNRSRGTMPAR